MNPESENRSEGVEEIPRIVSVTDIEGTSGQVTSKSMQEELLEKFKCSSCSEYAVTNINQCPEGHIVCSVCREKLSTCPECFEYLEGIRNTAMEKIAKLLNFPCKFAFNGCQASLHQDEKEVHEKACSLKPYFCPMPGVSTQCSWTGSLEEVLEHLEKSHNNTVLRGVEVTLLATDVQHRSNTDWVMLQHCHGYHFLLVLLREERAEGIHFLGFVQIIGSKEEAQKFGYKMELVNEGHSLVWESPMRSVYDGISSETDRGKCLYFNIKLAQVFFGLGNEDLSIKVKISKKEEPKKKYATTSYMSPKSPMRLNLF